MSALDSVKSRLEAGSSPTEVVRDLMDSDPALRNSVVVEHVTQILTREANQKLQLMRVASGSDDI
jgi:hypothetical protein